jgi:hypothetical protein
MSSYRYSRFLLGMYPRLTMMIYALLVSLILEEWAPDEEITWVCMVCKHSTDGVYIRDMDKHPYCEGNDKGKKHVKMKMTAEPKA